MTGFTESGQGHAVRKPGDHKGRPYSTVTDFARLRGWSTSVPMMTAV
jgi:hypothetical protein